MVRMGRSSLKLFHEDFILAVTASAQPPVFPVTAFRCAKSSAEKPCAPAATLKQAVRTEDVDEKAVK